MTWRENLRTANFRGIEFKVDTAQTTFGRRNVLHEYPLRNVPFAEDLGRKARTVTFSAYIVGPDYMAGRNDLMKAIEEKDTPGTLVHPTLGTMRVIPLECRVQFSNKEGGIEYFDLTFVEAGEQKFPDESFDTGSRVLTASVETKDIIKTVFDDTFSNAGVPQFVIDDSVGISGNFSALVRTAVKQQGALPETAASLTDALDKFDADIISLVQDPPSLSGQIQVIFEIMQGLYSSPNNVFILFQSLMTFGGNLVSVPLTTQTRIHQNQNRQNQIRIIRRYALIGMAISAIYITFTSYNEAITIRDTLADLLDAEILETGNTDDDESVNALEKLRAQMIEDITERGGNLRRIKRVIYQQSIPALVASYEVYDTSDYDAEIVARNHIKNPNFVPSGLPIEVLV